MGALASQITSLTIVYLSVYSGADNYNKTSKLRVTGLCAENSPVTSEFPAQVAADAEIVSICWRHHVHCTPGAQSTHLQPHEVSFGEFMKHPNGS